jgi:hypothetical protein
MVYVIAALVLVAAVAAVNLLFTLGLVRRLREHTELLSQGAAAHGAAQEEGVLHAGETVSDFSTTTVDGQHIDRESFSEGAMVAFFSPSCAPCRERVPEFVSHVTAIPQADRQAYAVVIGDEDATAEMVAALRPVARVLTGVKAEPIVAAFGVASYPALYRMDADGVVAASGHGMTVYPAFAAA